MFISVAQNHSFLHTQRNNTILAGDILQMSKEYFLKALETY